MALTDATSIQQLRDSGGRPSQAPAQERRDTLRKPFTAGVQHELAPRGLPLEKTWAIDGGDAATLSIRVRQHLCVWNCPRHNPRPSSGRGTTRPAGATNDTNPHSHSGRRVPGCGDVRRYRLRRPGRHWHTHFADSAEHHLPANAIGVADRGGCGLPDHPAGANVGTLILVGPGLVDLLRPLDLLGSFDVLRSFDERQHSEQRRPG